MAYDMAISSSTESVILRIRFANPWGSHLSIFF